MTRGRSASEAGPRPNCTCHDLPMRWNRRNDLVAGGYWRCISADRDSHRRWRETHREQRAAQLRAWQQANIEHRRAYQRAWRYGMKQSEYATLIATQGEFCAICELPASQSAKGTLHVDHDHATGRVRGLLCNRCNNALERVEKAGWTDRALAYLTR